MLHMEYLYLALFFLGLAAAVPTVRAALIGAPFFWAPKGAIREALEKAGVKKGDVVFDLGFGSGRALFEAEKIGARAVGLELSPLAYYFVKTLIFLRKTDRIEIYRENFFETDLSEADVVFCFLTPKAMERLKPKFKRELKKGTKIISYSFSIKDWQSKHTLEGYPGKVFIYEIQQGA